MLNIQVSYDKVITPVHNLIYESGESDVFKHGGKELGRGNGQTDQAG